MARLLAVFTKNSINPAYFAARLGADRVAQRFGFSTRHYVPTKPDDVSEQLNLIEQAIKDRPDAIILNPTHSTELGESVCSIIQNRIPIVLFINRLENVEGVNFVGADDRGLGDAIASHLFDHLQRPARIFILNGPTESATARDRAIGFLDALARTQAISVLGTGDGRYRRDIARSVFEWLVTEHGHVDGVLAANDLMALGVVDALAESKADTLVVGVNASPEAIQAIIARRMLATASYDAMGIACIAAEAAIRLATGKDVPDEVLLPVEIVNKSNCDRWQRPYEERACPEWEQVIERNFS